MFGGFNMRSYILWIIALTCASLAHWYSHKVLRWLFVFCPVQMRLSWFTLPKHNSIASAHVGCRCLL